MLRPFYVSDYVSQNVCRLDRSRLTLPGVIILWSNVEVSKGAHADDEYRVPYGRVMGMS
jgi:hypothetical protein